MGEIKKACLQIYTIFKSYDGDGGKRYQKAVSEKVRINMNLIKNSVPVLQDYSGAISKELKKLDFSL